MYNWITLLYTWNYHNIVNQLHPNIKTKTRKAETKLTEKSPSSWNLFSLCWVNLFPTTNVKGFWLLPPGWGQLPPIRGTCQCQPRALLTWYIDVGGPVAPLVGKGEHLAPVFCATICRPPLGAREHVQYTVGYWQLLAGKGAPASTAASSPRPDPGPGLSLNLGAAAAVAHPGRRTHGGPPPLQHSLPASG